ncbi:matrixin family metalloprotease [Candidatus Pacearchaeota archaeon]|nr:matrixin family metalloprotease [Candidatus Pacearchaeota archaeon]
MNYKLIFGSLFALFVCSTLILYLIIPADNFDLDAVEGILKFKVLEGNSNFTLGNFTENMMQKNMSLRFPTPNITYKIYDCPLQKQTDMLDAFKIMENETILKFNPVESGEQIKIDCDGETKMEEGLFVGGEGGPTNVSNIGKMYVIFNGKILLIRDSKCERPNIAIHELLHVLGFTHSENKNNIMYSISKCSQTIGDDIPQLINELYSIPSQPDLIFGNVTAEMNKRYLNTVIQIKNEGLADAQKSRLAIYAEDKFIKGFETNALPISYGTSITINNLQMPNENIKEIKYEIENPSEELDKENNKIILKIE